MFAEVSEATRPSETMLTPYKFSVFNIALETANFKIIDVAASNVICFVLNPTNLQLLDSTTTKQFTEI